MPRHSQSSQGANGETVRSRLAGPARCTPFRSDTSTQRGQVGGQHQLAHIQLGARLGYTGEQLDCRLASHRASLRFVLGRGPFRFFFSPLGIRCLNLTNARAEFKLGRCVEAAAEQQRAVVQGSLRNSRHVSVGVPHPQKPQVTEDKACHSVAESEDTTPEVNSNSARCRPAAFRALARLLGVNQSRDRELCGGTRASQNDCDYRQRLPTVRMDSASVSSSSRKNLKQAPPVL